VSARAAEAGRPPAPGERLAVCLGYPALQSAAHQDAVRAIDPRIEVATLPVDPDSVWITVPPAQPHEEPPPWAQGQRDARRRALAEAEVLIALHTPKDLLAHAPRLRWVQCVGAGVDQFVAAGVTRARALVTNASGLSATSMAEYVIGRLLQAWKRFPEQERLQRAHRYVQTYGRTFQGSTIGIVGFGSIGAAVGARAKALGARVLGQRRSYTPGMTHPAADELFGPDQLHEMLARCDAVVIAAPATDDTRHLIDAAALAAMPKGSMLVNVARGSLLDTDAFVAAMRSGHLGCAALDVFEEEPLPAESPLWDLENALLSAHSSVSTDRYMDDVFALFCDNLGRFVRGEALRNRVDMQALGFG